ncbi:hypothetical protein DL765_006365 [Monosporascus sp. GIB2]|nr:hypothetical protein DL765_006365 [Monosporascus sp. GIB2]
MVIIWLGERDSYNDKAMETLFATAEISRDTEYSEAFKREVVLHGIEKDGVLVALGKFFQREWWNRVWVIQEAAVAQRAMFLCGDKPLQWWHFLNAYLFWTVMLEDAVRTNQLNVTLQHLKYIIDGTSARVIMWQHGRMHGPQSEYLQHLEAIYGLQGMLEESWNFDSTDPRDKIYAWLGLLRDGDVAVEPNYDATTTQVYVGLVKAILEQIKSLRIVAFTGSAVREAKPPIDGLPSWAPDLRKDAIGIADKAPYWLRPKSFKASADEPANGDISDDLQTLTADAVRLGRIESVDVDTNESMAEGFEEKLCQWLYFTLSHKPHFSPDAGLLHDTIFRTFVCYFNDQHLGLADGGYQTQQLDMEHMRLGFMAYIGYLDRMQDYLKAKHAEAEQDTALELLREIEVPQTSGETKKIMLSDSATDIVPKIIRPEPMSSRIPMTGEAEGYQEHKAAPEPSIREYKNFLRFFKLFGLDTTSSSDGCDYLRLLRDFLLEHSCTWTKDMEDWPKHIRSDLESLLINRVQRFIIRFANVTAGKTFFRTKGDYFGLGLKPTRVADYVGIIRGCPIPVVIREHDGGDYFEVIGQCYVWGAMYGEFITTMDARGRKWESLKFR